jgi:prepilin-type N-terminal cleavage/methylation domain-containing protein
MRRTRFSRRHRGAAASGFTLIEMLVVIVVLVIITSAMIPVMQSASESRRMREAARLVNTMLSSAQSRAISSGRSVGVLFQPIRNKLSAAPVNPAAAMDLYLVETPPPYSGDTTGYTATVTYDPTTKKWYVTIKAPGGPPTFGGRPMSTDPTQNQTLIRNGDLIRFNYRGETYVLNFGMDTSQYVSSNTMTCTPTDPSRSPTDPYSYPPPSAGMPFQILRQPIKTMDPPVQLSDGAAVDLYFSGIDIAPTGTGAPTATVLGTMGIATDAPPLIVTFSPAGVIDQAYFAMLNTTTNKSLELQVRPLSGVYILVGKVDRIPNTSISPNLSFTDPNAPPNYGDPDCRWVFVTRQSGLVTTTETVNLAGAALPGSTLNQTDIQNVMKSRRYATSNQASSGQ